MDTTTLGYRLLECIGISGEIPVDLLKRIGVGDSYVNRLVKKLKDQGLMSVYSNDSLRGFRLTHKGKIFLLEQNPERFTFYLTGNTSTRQPRSEINRRLRLHYSSEIYVTLMNSKIKIFRDEKPLIFKDATQQPISFPVFYHSSEIKELGIETLNFRGSRATGIILTKSCVYVLYNTVSSLMKWSPHTEVKIKAFVKHHMSLGLLSHIYTPSTPVHALMMGKDMDILPAEMMEHRKGDGQFRLDTSFDHYHYLTMEHAGETLLRLLCRPELYDELRRLLLSDLEPANHTYPFEHDALKNGLPVLIAFDFDMSRLMRFKTALALNKQTGYIICFDFQEPAITNTLGTLVTVTTIDFVKFERRFYSAFQEMD